MVKVMKSKAIPGRTLGNKVFKIISSGCFGNRWVFRFLFAGVPGNSASSGRGIWPLLSYGVTKWKHWLIYPWFKGSKMEVSSENQDYPSKEVYVRSLDDLAEYCPYLITPKVLKNILIDLHWGCTMPMDSG